MTTADLSLLTGAPANGLLSAVLAEAGGTLLTWAATQVDHQPGRRTTVSYTAKVRWADDTVTDETLGASSGRLPDGVVRLSDGETEIGMWRFPFDPELPGLPIACDPDRVRHLLDRTGLPVGGDVRLRVRAYRPRRRAVVEVALPGQRRVFIKVVPPARVRDLHERHRLAAEAAVPASLGWTDDGLLLLAGLPGRTLREELLTAETVTMTPGSLTDVLDSLPGPLATGARRRTWGQKAGHYAEAIAAAAPELAERARGVAAAVDHETPEGPDIPVHGDLYESQLMMHRGRVSGLLDIDTAGRGERLDDAGCLLGHLAVLALMHPLRRKAIDRIQALTANHFALELDRAALSRRTAAVVLSLATGPFRVQEHDWPHHTEQRIALAERWLDMRSPSPVARSGLHVDRRS